MLLVIALAACAAPRVELRARVDADVSRARSVRVLPAEVVPLEEGDGALGSAAREALSGELRRLAEAGLSERGYRVAEDGGSDLQLAVSAKVDRVTRRTWSSDPDASALRDVELEEVVVVLRAFDGASPAEALRVEARRRLPDRALPFAPSLDELYRRTLGDAIDAFPAATGGV